MTAVRRPSNWISPEDYIAGELTSEVRHEYFAGEVVAMDAEPTGMGGASLAHNVITGNIFADLHVKLRGKSCQPFINDMKAHIQKKEDDWFYYPDVMVNCDPAGQQKYYCDTPSVIVEVMSPTTERIDRREKLMAYELIPSLHTYVLVSQERREVTIHRRTGDDWTTERLPENGDALRIPELEFEMTLDAIYARAGV
jgi:Uma2 family endonuclease